MMNLAEEIVTQCALAVHGKLTVDYQGVEISLERPWSRETMHNLVKEATGVDFIQLGNDLNAVKEATLSALPNNQDTHLIQSCSSISHVLSEVYEMVVEPTLVKPTFVLDYPVEISPLAKPHRRHAG